MMFGIKEVDAREFTDWLQKEGEGAIQIIDVRTPKEVQAGSVPGAEHLPLHQLPLRTEVIDRERPVVFVCRTGARSGQACAWLGQNGYDNVYNLRGGIVDWVRRGLPTGAAQSA